MSEKDNVAWSLLECIEKHGDCLKIKCNVFNKEFIVSRKGYENAICPTNFVFSRLIIELHYAIGEMIAVDNEPISFVEKAGFERLMSKTSPHYKVPCRKYFTETILPDMYSRVKEVVKTMLSTAKWMSLTSDVWTCKETRYSFISLTAHWIGDNFERKSAALSIKVFPGRHTGEAVSEKLTELLSFWDIDKIKVHLLMRDNGGNMKKGCRLCDIASESCTIHTLQLVIKGAIKSDKGVGILLKKCRKIATHIHKSSPSSSALAQIQVDLNIPIKK
ncbi:zinc finger BED domain-containing protein 4-like [Belonocnema kinseyi]|uniref:zinc finger BED domain-containing protein 4-like n=1 Tax=Belonocnema kinseyi TaxID=2817044 RepID=UPI00143D1545|nr:zinc finger BED domain-containing protein 4-like [Belonocnema kinseyi]